MGIFSTLKSLNKKTNSAYNFLKGFNSLLTGDNKTNGLYPLDDLWTRMKS